MKCVICHGPVVTVFRIYNFDIDECPRCPHRMTLPQNCGRHISRTYADSYFFGGHAGYPNYLSEKKILINHGRHYGKILRRHLKSGASVLDVGSAAGFIARGMVERGLKVQGVEPNQTMSDYARKTFRLNIATSSIESFKPGETFDCISFIQVIAHLIDPRAVLEACSRLLVPGGFVLIETWDYKSLTARLFGRKWHEYSPPSVLHWFTRQGLNRLALQSGLIYRTSGRSLKRLSLAHALALIQAKLAPSRQVKSQGFPINKFTNKLTVPYPLDDLFWVLYQKAT